ncbi:MAG: FtsW/RodA/SpoVE family cell cycle protein [Bryobacteraceae bacterium]
MAQRLKTDWILFATVVVMVGFGLLIVFSASSAMAELRYDSGYHFIIKQIFWAGVSLFILMFLKKMDYRRIKGQWWKFGPLGIVLILLVAAYVADPRRHRWLDFGWASLQPSEFAKPALVIFLAYLITERLRAINDRHTLLQALLAVAMLSGAVVMADLGTAVVLVFTSVTLLYVAGLEKRYLLMIAAGAAMLAVLAVAVKPYRLARIVGYVDPEYKLIEKIDPSGRIKAYAQNSLATRDTGYQARQSRIAVGSGGFMGVGPMNGTQKLLYLPEPHTDFIYAVVGEEFGFLGTSGILIGFLVILWRGLRLFFVSPDDFGRYLALGMSISVVAQAMINMSVVLDLTPTKGIPLPMISYGGSSLLSTLTSLGLLLSVSERSG